MISEEESLLLTLVIVHHEFIGITLFAIQKHNLFLHSLQFRATIVACSPRVVPLQMMCKKYRMQLIEKNYNL